MDMAWPPAPSTCCYSSDTDPNGRPQGPLLAERRYSAGTYLLHHRVVREMKREVLRRECGYA
jgi:hypothetical protein